MKNTNNRQTILSKYTAFIKVAGMDISPKILRLFGQAADGKKSHDEIRKEYADINGYSLKQDKK